MKLRTLFSAALILAPTLLPAQTRPTGPQWLAPDAQTEKSIKDALAEANHSHKRLALLYQGDWCGLCQTVIDTVHGDPDFPNLIQGYVSLPVNVSGPAVEDFAKKIHAILPKDNEMLITLMDPDGRVATAITAPRILDAGHLAPAKLKAILTEFRIAAPATDVFAQSLPALAASGKAGWVEFRADWCGWCKKMEKMFRESDAAPILAKYYTVVTEDTEKNEGAEQLARKLGSPNGVDGIPWFAVIDAQGKVLATSEGPKGNIGYPDTDVELAHFFKVLHSTAKGITDAEIATINKVLTAK